MNDIMQILKDTMEIFEDLKINDVRAINLAREIDELIKETTMNDSNFVLVTRHPALVTFIEEMGFKVSRTLTHASKEDVKGQHVIGVLPIHLAAQAASITVIPMDIPFELRGVELTLDQVRQFAGAPRRFKVEELAH